VAEPHLDPDLDRCLQQHLAVGAPALERAIAVEDAPLEVRGDPEAWVPFPDRPAGRELFTRPREELVSVAVAALHRALERSVQRELGVLDIAIVGEDHVIELVIDRLAGRKLPYSSLDAALLVRLATGVLWRDEARLALNAATIALAAEPGSSIVQAALQVLDNELDGADPLRRGKMADWRPKVRALLGVTDPASQLGAFFGIDDAWGPAAFTRVLALDGSWDVAGFLAHVASPRGGQPPAKWWPVTERWLADAGDAAALVVDLVRLATEVELTRTTPERHGTYAPPVILLDDTDTALVRGLAWAARFVGDDAVPALGMLALRSSAVVDGWWAADPISGKVALATIDTLGMIGTPTAMAELDQLFGEVTLAKLVRRIAAARGIPESRIKERLSQIRKGGRRRPRATPPES
jgi:hypothetical protein